MAEDGLNSIFENLSNVANKYSSFLNDDNKKIREEYTSKGYSFNNDGSVNMSYGGNLDVKRYKEETKRQLDANKQIQDQLKKNANDIYNLRKKQLNDIIKIQQKYGVLEKLNEQDLAKTKLDNIKQAYNEQLLAKNDIYKQLIEQETEIFNLSVENNQELTKEQIKNLAIIREKKLEIEENVNKKTAENIISDVKTGKKIGESIGTTIGTFIVKTVNKLSDIYIFDQLRSGITDLSNTYEQNFTSIAGYSGSDSRNANHNFIKGVLEEINANDYTRYGLNFSTEVFPEITNAVKEGFMGEEAQEIAISNAIDKKIMPWLDTSSETWTQLQFNLSDDKLQSIKGQQLLLQETREGNRLLQSGVIESIQNSLLPSMDNIVANTTEVDDLNEEMQQKYMYLTEDLGYSKQEAMKAINKEVEAYQNPYKALTSGDVGDKLLALDNLNGTDMMGSFARSMYGSGWVGSGAFAELTGIATGGETKTERPLYAYGGMEEGQKKYESTVGANLTDEQLKNIYQTKKSNLAENVTATQAYDNNFQNITAETVFDWNNGAHGMDIMSLMLDNIIAIKEWLFTKATNELSDLFSNFLGNFLGNKAGGRNTSSIVDSVTNLTKSSKLGKLAGFNSSGMGIALNTGVALAGTALTYKGIKDYKENDQIVKDDSATQYDKDAAGVKRGLSAATAGLGATAAVAGGTAAVTGALGVGGTLGAIGAAAGPVGWAALGLGAIALGAKKIYDITTDIGGAADQIKEEYDQQRDAIMASTRTNISTLTGILGELQSGVLDEEELQEKRNELIQSGILSQADEEKARTANQEQLEELTKSYANAAKEFNKEIARDFNKYNVETQAWSNDMWGGLEKGLQAFNDGYDPLHGIYRTEDFNKVANEVFTHVYTDLENKDYSSLDKESQKTLDNLKEFFENGSLDESEVNKIVDEGFFDSVLQSTDVSPETVELIYTVLKDMASTNEAAKVIVEDYMKTDHKYYDPEETTKALELLNKAQTATNTDSAIEYLEEFKQAGYKLSDYSDQKSELSTKWGTSIDLKGYKSGTSFVPYDNMIAELHYGERVLTNPENKEYTENQLSGNNGISTIQIGLQDIVSAIQQQTTDIITYLQSMNSMSSMNGLSNLNMSATMGATRVVV